MSCSRNSPRLETKRQTTAYRFTNLIDIILFRTLSAYKAESKFFDCWHCFLFNTQYMAVGSRTLAWQTETRILQPPIKTAVVSVLDCVRRWGGTFYSKIPWTPREQWAGEKAKSTVSSIKHGPHAVPVTQQVPMAPVDAGAEGGGVPHWQLLHELENVS